MSRQKRVAVIGAGPSGLTAIKACKEEHLDVVCYERNSDPGGLWKYHDEDVEGVPSVMRTTIINTSKEISAFSDFPPPCQFPNYMHNTMMWRYFMMYAKNFDLLNHIRYCKEVVRVEKADDFDSTGRWIVKTKDSKTGEVEAEIFDAVMVCMGHHVYPNVPEFPGQGKFKGKIIHTHSLKNCDKFGGMKVVVVGIGNSGVDAAVDSTFVAKQVYLSTRRGCWIFGRVGKNGVPVEMNLTTRFYQIVRQFVSFNVMCSSVEKALNEKFDHEAYNLKPKHRVFSAHPTVNDALPNCILSGRVVVKGDIKNFEENGVVFEGENEVTEADVVILATGYQIKFPFLSDDIVTTKKNRIFLYKFALPPCLKHPSLAIIGLIQPIGPIFPISEITSRWFVRILTGKLKVPSPMEMEEEIKHKNEQNAIRYVDSPRHTIQTDFIPLLDELSSMFGAKPNLLKLFFTDPKLFWACFTGPCLPYQFRLQGPHKWEGARDAILKFRERVYAPLNTRFQYDVKAKQASLLQWKNFLPIVFFIVLAVALGQWLFN